ncbi:MAG: hypothetical protein Q7K44_03980 [Candidatus Liptonbacteria bacterium]|nr:hypothetical protein [Candidatus Liptonbacteria bacterium]
MKKILYTSLLISLLGFAASSFAQTATPSVPKLFLTWSSNTYVPPGFAGKIMPTANSQITASVELIDGGKIVNLSKQNVYWYGNNNFLSGGLGMQSVTFRAPDAAGGTIDLRVEVPNYSKGNQLKTVAVPIARPEVVIEPNFPSGRFSSSPLQLAGQPYFFNTTGPARLNFSWSVNGQTPSGSENPQSLNIKFGPTMTPGSTLSVSLSVKNTDSKFQYETASKGVDFIYSP